MLAQHTNITYSGSFSSVFLWLLGCLGDILLKVVLEFQSGCVFQVFNILIFRIKDHYAPVSSPTDVPTLNPLSSRIFFLILILWSALPLLLIQIQMQIAFLIRLTFPPPPPPIIPSVLAICIRYDKDDLPSSGGAKAATAEY